MACPAFSLPPLQDRDPSSAARGSQSPLRSCVSPQRWLWRTERGVHAAGIQRSLAGAWRKPGRVAPVKEFPANPSCAPPLCSRKLGLLSVSPKPSN